MSDFLPDGNSIFTPQPEYGDVTRQTALMKEAPISGAPTPGLPAPSPGGGQAAPAPVMPGQAPMLGGAAYQAQLAETWRQLARLPGASPMVKQMAKQAQRDAQR